MDPAELFYRLRYARCPSEIVNEICQRELTEKQRQVVTLCVFEGLTVTQAAARLGVNKSTVSRHMARAKQRIERSLRYAARPLDR